jgi:predicted RNase H-like HicB family nuclease
MPKAKRKFTVILEPATEGGYTVHCPALPGCISQGDNRREALKNIKEALLLTLETLEDELMPVRVLESIQGNKVPPFEETPELIAEELRQILSARDEDGLSPVGVSLAEVQLFRKVSA